MLSTTHRYPTDCCRIGFGAIKMVSTTHRYPIDCCRIGFGAIKMLSTTHRYPTDCCRIGFGAIEMISTTHRYPTDCCRMNSEHQNNFLQPTGTRQTAAEWILSTRKWVVGSYSGAQNPFCSSLSGNGGL